jgi:hypothetical protein
VEVTAHTACPQTMEAPEKRSIAKRSILMSFFGFKNNLLIKKQEKIVHHQPSLFDNETR